MIAKYSCLLLIGGTAYTILELVFRGRTHWTMFLVGGICFIFLYIIAVNSQEPLWKKALMGGIIITTVEFLTGSIVNMMLHWNVWDYSNQKFNLFGQICLSFSAMWVALSVPAMALCKAIDKYIFMR